MRVISPGTVLVSRPEAFLTSPFVTTARVVTLLDSGRDWSTRKNTANSLIAIAKEGRGSFLPDSDAILIDALVTLRIVTLMDEETGLYAFCGNRNLRKEIAQLVVNEDGFLFGISSAAA